jgi:ribonuclease P protein subunit POP4
MNKKDLIRHELIGLNTEIVKAKNPTLVGLKGKIIDETKNTMTIKRKNKMKKVLKDQAVFNLKVGNKTFQVDGKVLVGRPEDRLKK